MRLRLLTLSLLLLTSCSQAPLSASFLETSAGCANLNDPFYDDVYLSGNVYFSPFVQGESVSVHLTESDAATTIYLIVSDTSGEARRTTS